MTRWIDLDPRERIVALALLNHCNAALTCWPGRELVAAECGMSESTFYRWRDSLEAKGWIHVERREHQASIVSLLPLAERLSDDSAQVPEYVREVLVALVRRAAQFAAVGIGNGRADSQRRESASGADSHQRGQPIPSTDTQKDEDSLRESSTHSKGGESAAGASDSQGAAEAGEQRKVLTLDGEPYTPTSEAEAVEAIFNYWAAQMRKPKVKLNAKRRNLISARLREGWSPQDLMTAIAGNAADAWYQGENDRQQPFNELELILRDASKVERFIALAENPRGRPRSKAEQRRDSNVDAARSAVEKIRNKDRNHD